MLHTRRLVAWQVRHLSKTPRCIPVLSSTSSTSNNSSNGSRHRSLALQTLMQPPSSVVLRRLTFANNNSNSNSLPNFDTSLEKHAELLASKTTRTLIRSSFVLWCSSIKFVAQHASKILDLFTAIVGRDKCHKFLRATIFAHFVAGETAETIRPVVEELDREGIRCMLDYAAESDLGNNKDLTEEEADQNVHFFLECIEAAKSLPHANACVALKLSALGQPVLLEHITKVVLSVRSLFSKFGSPQLNEKQFLEGLSKLGVSIDAKSGTHLFQSFDTKRKGVIDLLDWIEHLSPENINTRRFFTTTHSESSETVLPTLSQPQVASLLNLNHRLQTIAKAAAEGGVHLLVDAEHTYYQPAIDHLTMNLQREYNRDEPIVYNTYQAYLKNCHRRLCIDMERAKRENFKFAAKLVRGAYMVQERARAKKMGYDDPIQPKLQFTHNEYQQCVDDVLEANQPTYLVVATHNRESIRHVVKRMCELNIDRDRVFFGQLLGMADPISLALAAHHYRVYKYIPFGPIDEVIPYLLRRAEENASVGAVAKEEYRIYLKEIKRRLQAHF